MSVCVKIIQMYIIVRLEYDTSHYNHTWGGGSKKIVKILVQM